MISTRTWTTAVGMITIMTTITGMITTTIMTTITSMITSRSRQTAGGWAKGAGSKGL